MIVISDTSPISALLRIGYLQLLEQIFKEVIIPKKVLEELMRLEEFDIDIQPIISASWIKVKEPKQEKLLTDLLARLDEGEAHAIALAIEHNSDLLIIDEFEGRKIAQEYQLKITGIVGILIQAKNKGLVSQIKPLLDMMISKANFFLNKRLYDEVLKIANEL